MDYARKSVKKQPTSPMTTISSISLNLTYPTTSSEPQLEDKKLKNWKKWLANRKKHYEVYKKKLGRNQDELLLNSGEKYRSFIETRELMEKAGDSITAAYIQKNIDLAFWITPEVLPDHGNPNLPEVEVSSKTSIAIPKIEHVSIPKMICEEKGLSVPKQKTEWKDEYLQKRTEELSDVISVIEPHPPKMENLFVKGNNFKKCSREGKHMIKKVPIITITTAEEIERKTSEWSVNHDDMIAVLRIENAEIARTLNPKSQSKNVDNCLCNWDIQFESRASELVERNIFMENKGNIKITYYWRPVILSSNLISNKKVSAFFFNKNKGIILPGQILNFPMWFKSCQPGVKSENWKLVTDPRLSSEDLLFRFWGCSSGEDLKENYGFTKINSYLDNRIRDSVIRAVLEEIVYDALIFQPPDPPYKNLFLKSEIFLAKNPSYFYHPDLVKEFREIYNSISISDGPEWNLSLFDLRKILLEIEDPEFQQMVLARFVELCRASLEPSLYSSTTIRKHEMVFDLLCSFANQFETESEFIKNIYFGCREMEIEHLVVTNRGANSRSNSFTGTSSGALAPWKKLKSQKKNRKRILSTQSKEEEQKNRKVIILKPSDAILFREIFYLRIYELLGETISKACATIDSFASLNEPEK